MNSTTLDAPLEDVATLLLLIHDKYFKDVPLENALGPMMSLLTDMELIGNKVNFLDIELIRKELNVSNHQNLSFSFEIFYDWLRLLALFIFNEENANIDNHSKSLYSLLSSHIIPLAIKIKSNEKTITNNVLDNEIIFILAKFDKFIKLWYSSLVTNESQRHTPFHKLWNNIIIENSNEMKYILTPQDLIYSLQQAGIYPLYTDEDTISIILNTQIIFPIDDIKNMNINSPNNIKSKSYNIMSTSLDDINPYKINKNNNNNNNNNIITKDENTIKITNNTLPIHFSNFLFILYYIIENTYLTNIINQNYEEFTSLADTAIYFIYIITKNYFDLLIRKFYIYEVNSNLDKYISDKSSRVTSTSFILKDMILNSNDINKIQLNITSILWLLRQSGIFQSDLKIDNCINIIHQYINNLNGSTSTSSHNKHINNINNSKYIFQYSEIIKLILLLLKEIVIKDDHFIEEENIHKKTSLGNIYYDYKAKTDKYLYLALYFPYIFFIIPQKKPIILYDLYKYNNFVLITDKLYPALNTIIHSWDISNKIENVDNNEVISLLKLIEFLKSINMIPKYINEKTMYVVYEYVTGCIIPKNKNDNNNNNQDILITKIDAFEILYILSQIFYNNKYFNDFKIQNNNYNMDINILDSLYEQQMNDRNNVQSITEKLKSFVMYCDPNFKNNDDNKINNSTNSYTNYTSNNNNNNNNIINNNNLDKSYNSILSDMTISMISEQESKKIDLNYIDKFSLSSIHIDDIHKDNINHKQDHNIYENDISQEILKRIQENVIPTPSISPTISLQEKLSYTQQSYNQSMKLEEHHQPRNHSRDNALPPLPPSSIATSINTSYQNNIIQNTIENNNDRLLRDNVTPSLIKQDIKYNPTHSLPISNTIKLNTNNTITIYNQFDINNNDDNELIQDIDKLANRFRIGIPTGFGLSYSQTQPYASLTASLSSALSDLQLLISHFPINDITLNPWKIGAIFASATTVLFSADLSYTLSQVFRAIIKVFGVSLLELELYFNNICYLNNDTFVLKPAVRVSLTDRELRILTEDRILALLQSNTELLKWEFSRCASTFRSTNAFATELLTPIPSNSTYKKRPEDVLVTTSAALFWATSMASIEQSRAAVHLDSVLLASGLINDQGIVNGHLTFSMFIIYIVRCYADMTLRDIRNINQNDNLIPLMISAVRRLLKRLSEHVTSIQQSVGIKVLKPLIGKRSDGLPFILDHAERKAVSRQTTLFFSIKYVNNKTNNKMDQILSSPPPAGVWDAPRFLQFCKMYGLISAVGSANVAWKAFSLHIRTLYPVNRLSEWSEDVTPPLTMKATAEATISLIEAIAKVFDEKSWTLEAEDGSSKGLQNFLIQVILPAVVSVVDKNILLPDESNLSDVISQDVHVFEDIIRYGGAWMMATVADHRAWLVQIFKSLIQASGTSNLEEPLVSTVCQYFTCRGLLRVGLVASQIKPALHTRIRKMRATAPWDPQTDPMAEELTVTIAELEETLIRCALSAWIISGADKGNAFASSFQFTGPESQRIILKYCDECRGRYAEYNDGNGDSAMIANNLLGLNPELFGLRAGSWGIDFVYPFVRTLQAYGRIPESLPEKISNRQTKLYDKRALHPLPVPEIKEYKPYHKSFDIAMLDIVKDIHIEHSNLSLQEKESDVQIPQNISTKLMLTAQNLADSYQVARQHNYISAPGSINSSRSVSPFPSMQNEIDTKLLQDVHDRNSNDVYDSNLINTKGVILRDNLNDAFTRSDDMSGGTDVGNLGRVIGDIGSHLIEKTVPIYIKNNQMLESKHENQNEKSSIHNNFQNITNKSRDTFSQIDVNSESMSVNSDKLNITQSLPQPISLNDRYKKFLSNKQNGNNTKSTVRGPRKTVLSHFSNNPLLEGTKEAIWPVYATFCSCGDSLEPGKLSGPNLFILLARLGVLTDDTTLADIGVLLHQVSAHTLSQTPLTTTGDEISDSPSLSFEEFIIFLCAFAHMRYNDVAKTPLFNGKSRILDNIDFNDEWDNWFDEWLEFMSNSTSFNKFLEQCILPQLHHNPLLASPEDARTRDGLIQLFSLDVILVIQRLENTMKNAYHKEMQLTYLKWQRADIKVGSMHLTGSALVNMFERLNLVPKIISEIDVLKLVQDLLSDKHSQSNISSNDKQDDGIGKRHPISFPQWEWVVCVVALKAIEATLQECNLTIKSQSQEDLSVLLADVIESVTDALNDD